jgi:predicted small lipoprotein YifL
MKRRIIASTIIIMALCLLLVGCAQPTPTPLPPATVMVAQAAEPTEAAQAEATPTPEPAVTLAPTAIPTATPRAFVRASVIDGRVLVEIVVEHVENLYGVEAHLTYDPAVVQVQDADPDFPGINLIQGPAFPKGKSFAALNQADNDQGTVDLAYTLLNPAPAIKGSVVVAQFEAIPLKDAELEIGVKQLLLADSSGKPIRAAVAGTSLAVKP